MNKTEIVVDIRGKTAMEAVNEFIWKYEKLFRNDMEAVNEFIRSYQKLSQNNIETVENLFQEGGVDKEDSKRKDKKQYLNIVRKVIMDIGIPAHINGYRYLRDATLYCLEKNENISVTKELYPAIAKKYEGTTESQVERGIRTAIEGAWRKGNLKCIDSIFGYNILPDKGKPTNSQCIYAIVEHVKYSCE